MHSMMSSMAGVIVLGIMTELPWEESIHIATVDIIPGNHIFMTGEVKRK